MSRGRGGLAGEFCAGQWRPWWQEEFKACTAPHFRRIAGRAAQSLTTMRDTYANLPAPPRHRRGSQTGTPRFRTPAYGAEGRPGARPAVRRARPADADPGAILSRPYRRAVETAAAAAEVFAYK